MSSVAVPALPAHRVPVSAADLRRQLESSLAERVPGAFTVHDRTVPDMASSGVAAIDALTGGLPRGALSEIFGAASSGRTSVLLAALASATQRGEACALIDASDSFDPESATVAGVDLAKLLWIRCGRRELDGALSNSTTPQPASHKRANEALSPPVRDIGIWGYGATDEMVRVAPRLAPHGKGQSPNRMQGNRPHPNRPNPIGPALPVRISSAQPRTEWSRREESAPRAAQPRVVQAKQDTVARYQRRDPAYARIEQALKAADLLIAGGGFGVIALDFAGLPSQAARRVPLVSWFRFRRAVENTPAVLLLCSPEPLTQSCASVVLRLHAHRASVHTTATAFAGEPPHARLLTALEIRAEAMRSPAIGRQPPHSVPADFAAHSQFA